MISGVKTLFLGILIMSSVEIYIVTEGQTEQTFIRDVLAPNMAMKGIYLHAMLIGNPGHKGGDVRFSRAQQDIEKILQQRSNTYVSTMFDYFRIDSNWPGKKELEQQINQGRNLSVTEKAQILQKATLSKIKENFSQYEIEKRFIPYIGMHEFEALLFSDAEILANEIKVPLEKINIILTDYETPEEINSDPLKAPSKRLIELRKGYKKVIMGKVISEAIGITTIRKQCLHFDSWLIKLESL